AHDAGRRCRRPCSSLARSRQPPIGPRAICEVPAHDRCAPRSLAQAARPTWPAEVQACEVARVAAARSRYRGVFQETRPGLAITPQCDLAKGIAAQGGVELTGTDKYQLALFTPSVARCASTVSICITSAYLWWRSKRLTWCEIRLLSKQHSSTSTTWKPCEKASTAVARTQPEVLSPQTTSVWMPNCVRCAISGVPKKTLARCLVITMSP